jgi:predicted membrane protein
MRQIFWGIVLMVIGFLFLLDNLGYADAWHIISNYWPLILIVIGLSLIMRKRSTPQEIHIQGASKIDSDLLHQSNVFGDINIKTTSSDFTGGSLSTVFGDCDIDLSSASFAEGEHELRIHSVFGDSLIILPEGAAVTISANSVFGALRVLDKQKGGFSSNLETTTPAYDSNSRRMKIIISKVFGDVKVE